MTVNIINLPKINLVGNNIFRDILTVKNAVNQSGGEAQLVWRICSHVFMFKTPAMTHYILPVQSSDPVYNVSTDDKNIIHDTYHKKKSHSLLVVHFTQPEHVYRAFDWDELMARGHVVTPFDGSDWNYMEIINQCPHFEALSER